MRGRTLGKRAIGPAGRHARGCADPAAPRAAAHDGRSRRSLPAAARGHRHADGAGHRRAPASGRPDRRHDRDPRPGPHTLPPAVWFPVPPGWRQFAATIDPTAMTDAQYTVVRSFLMRNRELQRRRALLAGRRPGASGWRRRCTTTGTPRCTPRRTCCASSAATSGATSRLQPVAGNADGSHRRVRSLVRMTALHLPRPCGHHAHAPARRSTAMLPYPVASSSPIRRARTASPARRARRSTRPATSVAGVIGCEPGEVVFTSGGTEADNTAVLGRRRPPRRHRRVPGRRAPRGARVGRAASHGHRRAGHRDRRRRPRRAGRCAGAPRPTCRWSA